MEEIDISARRKDGHPNIPVGVFSKPKKFANGALEAFEEILAAGEEVQSGDEAALGVAAEADATEQQQSLQAGSASITASTEDAGGNPSSADVVIHPQEEHLVAPAEINAASQEAGSVSGEVIAPLHGSESAFDAIAVPFEGGAAALADLTASTQGRHSTTCAGRVSDSCDMYQGLRMDVHFASSSVLS